MIAICIVVNCCIMLSVIGNGVSMNNKAEIFIKSKKYPVASNLLSTKTTGSILECVAFCMDFKPCSMIMITSTQNNMPQICSSYEINNITNNSNLSMQHDVTVWYKTERFIELFESLEISMTPHSTVTSTADCPSPFVRIGSGCFYADVGMIYNGYDAEASCQNVGITIGRESVCAYFVDVDVSKRI